MKKVVGGVLGEVMCVVDDAHHPSQSHLLPIEGDGSAATVLPSLSSVDGVNATTSLSRTTTPPTSRLEPSLTAVEHNGGLRNMKKEVSSVAS